MGYDYYDDYENNEAALLAYFTLGDPRYPISLGYLAVNPLEPTQGHVHAGIDFGAIRDLQTKKIIVPIEGTQIKAVTEGVMIRAGEDYLEKNGERKRSRDDEARVSRWSVHLLDHNGNTVIYGPLTAINKTLLGQKVPAGTVIGYIAPGQAGSATNPHLHIEVRRGRHVKAVEQEAGVVQVSRWIPSPTYYSILLTGGLGILRMFPASSLS